MSLVDVSATPRVASVHQFGMDGFMVPAVDRELFSLCSVEHLSAAGADSRTRSPDRQASRFCYIRNENPH